MKVTQTTLPDVLIIEPKVFGDARGFFVELYHGRRYREAGVPVDFVQDNMSLSRRGTLRGLHYQHPNDQAKLVQVLQGEVFDVAVDIRKGSPAFGKWYGAYLSEENKRQLFIPAGFAHGFCVTSDSALLMYKCSDYYNAAADGAVAWNDPDIGIEWPVTEPLLSTKGAAAPRLRAAGRLPAIA